MDAGLKKTLQEIPLHKTNAGPRDGDKWVARLKEEYHALIEYVKRNKAKDEDWFKLESNPEGTRWFGTCWTFIDGLKYDFDVEFDVSMPPYVCCFDNMSASRDVYLLYNGSRQKLPVYVPQA
eukprot:m.31089 g.31089  ORF g.31089 m.31089 type:complete len:122 (-) comp4772_c0_seq1:434-799(-)